MRGDFSRIPNDSFKHYIASFMQQGRVQLDADWNQNVENFLDILWKYSCDSIGSCACLGDSFRVGKDIPIDHMLQTNHWKRVHHHTNLPDPDGYIFLDTNNRPRTNPHSVTEKGSLFVQNAEAILRKFNSLDLSRFKTIYVRFKIIGNSNNENSCNIVNKDVRSWLSLDNYEYTGHFVENSLDAGGFCKIRFDLLEPQDQNPENFDKYDISHISELSVHWEKDDNRAANVCIGLISAEPLALVVTANDADISRCWANVTSQDNNNTTATTTQQTYISYTYNGKPTIKKEKGIKQISWSFSRPKNFHSLNVLRLAIRKNNGAAYCYKLFLANSNQSSNNDILEYSLNSESGQDKGLWRSYIVDIKRPDNAENISADRLREFLKEIKTIGLKDLPEKDPLYVSEILGELNFENNFLISGDMDLNQSATMYVNGLLCSMNHWDTYLTQKDASSDNADALLISSTTDKADENNKNNEQEQYGARTLENTNYYMAYADVWNRGITYLEDPEIRELALGGPDTTTRLQTICQIKLTRIEYDDDRSSQRDAYPVSFHDRIIDKGERKIKEMNEERSGSLSVIGPHNSSLLSTNANFRTVGNHLYRIQIHDSEVDKWYESNSGSSEKNIAKRTTFKWSKDNASVAFPIKQLNQDSVLLEQGARSLVGVFQIGDFIEIIDDIDELSEEPRGRMRRITDINIEKRTLFWTSSTFNSDKIEIKSLHDPIKIEGGRYQQELHPKVILWNGMKYFNATQEADEGQEGLAEDLISLDGSIGANEPIKIKFHPGVFRTGHYWTFTTRSNGEIELLRSAKPMGPNHAYAPLALIKKEIGKEIEVVEDLRHTFQPLANLRAIDIPYDNGNKTHSGSTTVQAAIQRLSGGRIRVLPGRRNNETIKDLLIEAGEIYELKPAKGSQKAFRSRISFNDIYEHQPFLMYTITSGNGADVRHEIHMFAADEEGNIFKDPIDDGTKNYAWKGFEIEADENAQVSWLAIGDSYTYFERFVKRILDEILRVIFGVDTDQLKEDSSVLDAWYKKDLQNLSKAGPGLARQAREHWETLQNDWDRVARKIDKQVNDFQEDLGEVFDNKEEEENAVAGAVEARELPEPVAQTVNCPSCGQSYPKGKYTFCTKCRTKLPNE